MVFNINNLFDKLLMSFFVKFNIDSGLMMDMLYQEEVILLFIPLKLKILIKW